MSSFRGSCTGLVWMGVCVAAITACGKRVDPSSRDNSAPPRTSARPANFPSQPPAGAATAAPIIHVTAEQLEDLLRHRGGQSTLVNVWATWCGPCREELPMLAKIQQAYQDRGITVLPLSVDEPEQEGKIPSLLQAYGFRGPFYVASRPLDELKRRLSEAWPGNIPVSFLFDGTGRRRFFWTAQVYESELVPTLDRFLAGQLEPGQANFAVAPGKTL